MASDRTSPEERLSALRGRADEDFLAPPLEREHGRHSEDLPELGIRVTVTRSRYPNRPDGVDQYAVTVSRIDMQGPPHEGAVRHALDAAFGAAALAATERSGGPAVRMFRVPVR